MLRARARPEGGEKEPVRETELCGTVPGQAGLMPAGSPPACATADLDLCSRAEPPHLDEQSCRLVGGEVGGVDGVEVLKVAHVRHEDIDLGHVVERHAGRGKHGFQVFESLDGLGFEAGDDLPAGGVLADLAAQIDGAAGIHGLRIGTDGRRGPCALDHVHMVTPRYDGQGCAARCPAHCPGLPHARWPPACGRIPAHRRRGRSGG